MKKYIVFYVDVDLNSSLASKYKIRAIPTYLIVNPSEQTLSKNSGAMDSKKFIDKFGLHRKEGDSFNQRHYDIAATAQKVLEDTIIKAANNLYKKTYSLSLSWLSYAFKIED